MAVRTLWSWVAPRSETMVSLEEPSLLWSASILQRNSGVVFWKLPTTAPTDGDRLELIRGTLTLSVVKWEELAAAWRKCFKRTTRYLSSCPKSPFKHASPTWSPAGSGRGVSKITTLSLHLASTPPPPPPCLWYFMHLAPKSVRVFCICQGNGLWACRATLPAQPWQALRGGWEAPCFESYFKWEDSV